MKKNIRTRVRCAKLAIDACSESLKIKETGAVIFTSELNLLAGVDGLLNDLLGDIEDGPATHATSQNASQDPGGNVT